MGSDSLTRRGAAFKCKELSASSRRTARLTESQTTASEFEPVFRAKEQLRREEDCTARNAICAARLGRSAPPAAAGSRIHNVRGPKAGAISVAKPP